MNPNIIKSIDGITINITKIEFAEKETRVYLAITNNLIDGSNFSLYQFDSCIVYNQKQYEQNTNYDANYPSINTEIVNGVSTDGIITFKPIDFSSGGEIKILLDSSLKYKYENDYPFSFDIPIE